MVATYTAHKALACCRRGLFDFDPDTTDATVVTLGPGLETATDKCVPIANFRRFVAGLVRSVGTGSVTSFKIIAATAADGTGNTAVVAHAIGSAPNAVGDYIWLECDVEQIHEVLPTATHVGVEISLVTSTDECIVYFEESEPFHGPRAGLTDDFIS